MPLLNPAVCPSPLPPPLPLLPLPLPVLPVLLLLRNFDFVQPSHPGRILQRPPPTKGSIPNQQALLAYIYGPNTDQSFQAFLDALGFAFAFFPLIKKDTQTLIAGYNKAAYDSTTKAAAQALSSSMRGLSASIQAREGAGKPSTVPPYTLLDPSRLPYNTYI